MKKITLFVCALATAVASFAAPKATKLDEASKARQARVETQTIQKEQAPLFKSVEAKEAALSSDTIFIPYAVPGAFHYGSNYRGIFYYSHTNYITPYAESLTFYNDYNFVSTWEVAGAVVGQDTAVVLPLDGFGDYNGYTPVMKTPKYVPNDSTEYVFPDYQYGAGEVADLEAQHPGEDFSDWKGIINAPCYIYPLTQAAIFSENESNYYFPWDYGTYGAATGGDYWYGTKLVNNYLAQIDTTTTHYFDTTAVYVSNPGVMYIRDVMLAVWTKGTAYFPNEGDHIRLTLYPVNSANGFPDWKNPIASATASTQDLSAPSGWNSILTFSFLDIDPITGNYDTVPAIVEGNFYAVLDEYNDGTANFGFLTDDEMTTNANTLFFFYYPGKGEVYTQKYRTPANLVMSFNAFMPIVADAPEAIYFEEGAALTQTVILNTNTWGEDYDFDAPSWIDMEAETVYDLEDEHTYQVKLTITVQESNEAREGILSINADYFEFDIAVKQNIAQGIENVSFKNNNKLYNVLGQEVNEDYQGVVIRNGEKFIR